MFQRPQPLILLLLSLIISLFFSIKTIAQTIVVPSNPYPTIQSGIKLIGSHVDSCIIERDSCTMEALLLCVDCNEKDAADFQWQLNGKNILDDTDSILTIDHVSLTDEGVYQCIIYNDFCFEIKTEEAFSEVIQKSFPYYHAFQNFDDDVDLVKTFTNFFGGNNGVYDEGSPSQIINKEFDPDMTRTGYGRSLKLDYATNPNFWSMYLESFDREWFEPETSFDLTNLFPDFNNPGFQNRQIDSLVFYYKLNATNPLSVSLELHNDGDVFSAFSYQFNNSFNWERAALALEDFTGSFDPTIAKFFGIKFLETSFPQSGTIHLDDFYLVEKDFEKPIFADQNEMLKYLNEVNFRHMWMAVEPQSKFALDRHTFRDLISVDAIGFQLSSYVIAHKNNWIEPDKIEARVEHILNYLWTECNHTDDPADFANNPLGFATIKGNWAHFLGEDLQRKDEQTEFSLFTNALLLAGVISAREYFSDNSNITNDADSLIALTDWNFLFKPENNLMYFAWKPNSGYTSNYTDWFSEELDLAFLLALTSPDVNHRIPSNPYFESEYIRPLCADSTYIYSAPGTNFTYYFLQMYAKYAQNTNRFLNTKNALLADLAFTQTEYLQFDYDSRIFGTTACEGPDAATGGNSNYHAYGYCCRFDTTNVANGTVAIYGSGASTLFIPSESKSCLAYYYNELDSEFINTYGYNFWSPIFGFPDAFHLSPEFTWDVAVNSLDFNGPWISVPRFGIDVGPMLMNIDSYLAESNQEASIRDYFSNYLPLSEAFSDFSTIPINSNISLTLQGDSLVGNDLYVKADSAAWVYALSKYSGENPIYTWFVNDIEITDNQSNSLHMVFPEGASIRCIISIIDSCLTIASDTSEVFTVVYTDLDTKIKQSPKFSISPNPTTGMLQLNISNLEAKAPFILKIVNTDGKVIKEKTITTNFAHLREDINISNFPPGVYFLSVASPKLYFVEKVLLLF